MACLGLESCWGLAVSDGWPTNAACSVFLPSKLASCRVHPCARPPPTRHLLLCCFASRGFEGAVWTAGLRTKMARLGLECCWGFAVSHGWPTSAACSVFLPSKLASCRVHPCARPPPTRHLLLCCSAFRGFEGAVWRACARAKMAPRGFESCRGFAVSAFHFVFRSGTRPQKPYAFKVNYGTQRLSCLIQCCKIHARSDLQSLSGMVPA